jgi:hypothetical protein
LPLYKNFSYIARPLTSLLAKDAPFEFDDECLNAFQILKKSLISSPIIQPLIGHCLLKSCVMLVTILWGQFWVKQNIESIMQFFMLVKLC